MRTPATRARKAPKEIGLHMSVAAYLRRAWPEHLPWTHFPAGELRDARTGGKLKAMGLAAGWPDFILMLPRGQVGFIELKRAGGSMSDAQADFREACIANGHGHAVCRSLEEVEAVVTRWLGAFDLTPRARIVARAA